MYSSTLPKIENIKLQGFTAYENGVLLYNNPYQKNELGYAAWRVGWLKAYEHFTGDEMEHEKE